MVSKVDISDIRLDQLDRSSVAWVAKFAHTLRQHNGEVISLTDINVLEKVVAEAKKTESDELKSIYLSLKSAMKAHMNKKRS